MTDAAPGAASAESGLRRRNAATFDGYHARVTTTEEARIMLQVERVLAMKYPILANRRRMVRPTVGLLKRILREQELNAFLEAHRGLEGLEFLERVLEYFNFSYTVVGSEKENIPAEGRVVIVANHPLGALDGLALLKLVSEVRPDVRIVANDLLMHLAPLRSLLLPVDNLGRATRRADIGAIHRALANDEAVIVFPSGEVSRAGPAGIRDGRWNDGFLRFAERSEAPVLPVYLGGKNSALFYGLSAVCKRLSTLMLVREMFRQRDTALPIRIGKSIPWTILAASKLSRVEKARRISRQVYLVAKGGAPLFETDRPIAHPEPRVGLYKELQAAERLGATRDGKEIFLLDYRPNSPVLREIGRLREIAFRRVGEGTGNRRDRDDYDSRYRHLVLWDNDDLQIAGAYRLGEVAPILAARGEAGLYTHSLFSYGDPLRARLPQALELGRSFVQPRYWGMRSLDCLWHGIGAYLRSRPEIRYLFGPVTLSDAYPRIAKSMLVYFYRRHFGDPDNWARARVRYGIPDEDRAMLPELFGGSYDADFRRLKERLGKLGVAVPTLYKQYTELCEPGGVRFLDFSVDAQFANCVDGLVWVDLQAVKASKWDRYIGGRERAIALPEVVRAYA